MEKTKLREIINVGETQEVELKQSFHNSQDFSKLMCGLANTFGGISSSKILKFVLGLL